VGRRHAAAAAAAAVAAAAAAVPGVSGMGLPIWPGGMRGAPQSGTHAAALSRVGLDDTDEHEVSMSECMWAAHGRPMPAIAPVAMASEAWL